MADRVSSRVLLCEDEPHEKLVREYLRKSGLETRPPVLTIRNASRLRHGGNRDDVLRRFPVEYHACVKRSAKAETRLIVVIDADDLTVDQTRDELKASVAGHGAFDATVVVLLIPKRHVETWIRSALGEPVDEAEDCKPTPAGPEIRRAAATIHGWARGRPEPGPACVPSLRRSLPDWRGIG